MPIFLQAFTMEGAFFVVLWISFTMRTLFATRVVVIPSFLEISLTSMLIVTLK